GIGSPVVVRCGRRQLTVPYLETFAAVAPGEIVAYTHSAGLISLAVNAGDAAEQLGLPPGAHVRLSAARPSRRTRGEFGTFSNICANGAEKTRAWQNAVYPHGRQRWSASEVPPSFDGTRCRRSRRC